MHTFYLSNQDISNWGWHCAWAVWKQSSVFWTLTYFLPVFQVSVNPCALVRIVLLLCICNFLSKTLDGNEGQKLLSLAKSQLCWHSANLHQSIFICPFWQTKEDRKMSRASSLLIGRWLCIKWEHLKVGCLVSLTNEPYMHGGERGRGGTQQRSQTLLRQPFVKTGSLGNEESWIKRDIWSLVKFVAVLLLS